jgi:TPR repeat protein
MSIRWKVAGILLLAAAAAAMQAQDAGGAQRGFQPTADEPTVKSGHQYVVAIGIDHYENWPILSTAVSDATGFAKLLTSKFGFEYAVEPLTEKNATREAIISLIDDDLRNRLKPEDSLVIFFAGHGTTRSDKIGDQTRSVGFIVPVDARASGTNEHWSDYLNVEELLRTISSLPAAHILVVLDSCHSGMALGSKYSTSRDDTRFQKDMLVKVSRKVIASAQGDQLAADSGPLPDHSLFTGLMIQGLTSGRADNFGEGFVTSSQLGAYAQHEVAVAAGSKQTPLFGSFDLDEGGELVIHMGAGSTPATADSSNPAVMLTKYESLELDRLKKQGNLYWQDDDPLKNFPAARSAALKLCDGGDSWGCDEAARSFRTGLGGGTDYPQASKLAQRACDAHLSDACVLLANIDQTGLAIEPDLQSAVRLFEDACTQGNLRGCFGLGRMYLDGHGVTQDFAQTKTLFSKACDGGEMAGCNGLGALYENGAGVTQDYAQAKTLYTKACDGGFMRSCENVGRMILRGRGVTSDPAQAVEYFRKGCAGGEMDSCSALGEMYQSGQGVAADLSQATTLYRKACDGGSATGCNDMGLAYEMGKGATIDMAQAAVYFRKACDASGTGMYGCNNLGLMYVRGTGVPRDLHEAARLYRKACDAGQMIGCDNAGDLYRMGAGVTKDEEEAVHLYRTACNGGNLAGCTQFGFMLESGVGTRRTNPRQSGCSARHATAAR